MTSVCPSIGELVEAVREFIEQQLQPTLEGQRAFQVRVAVNALGIVQRELELGSDARQTEAAGLRSLLKTDAELDELNRELCRRIRAGDISYQNRRLLDHLRRTTMDRLAIDNPRYATFRHLLEQRDPGA